MSETNKTIAELEEQIAYLKTWKGLMSLVDKHYPPDVFDGSSGNAGARIIVLLREIERLTRHLELAFITCESGEAGYFVKLKYQTLLEAQEFHRFLIGKLRKQGE